MNAPCGVLPAPASAAFPLEDELLPAERLLRVDPKHLGVPAVAEWDIPQTISALGYLTHNFYRYYGKFPPTIPRKLLLDLRPAAGSWVLDNFSGSGTTLVEAKLLGVPSMGVDISPLATLAATVKTRRHDLDEVRDSMRAVLGAARCGSAESAPRVAGRWFSEQTCDQLSRLKSALLALDAGPEREFLVLAFVAIIRRVSRAYDGEVRPHLNPEKPQRDAFEVFERKVLDMLARAEEFQARTNAGVPALAVCGDNRRLGELLPEGARPGLVISHPPYLNCFDYVPVYKLEYSWAEGFPELGEGWTYESLRRSETRSWPATDAAIYADYFEGIRRAYLEVAKVAANGTRCCVVLGDCTIRGEVIDVLDRLVALMAGCGFALEKMIYRTTHYGTGKYAYSTRADYHGDSAGKRDGIAIFRLG